MVTLPGHHDHGPDSGALDCVVESDSCAWGHANHGEPLNRREILESTREEADVVVHGDQALYVVDLQDGDRFDACSQKRLG